MDKLMFYIGSMQLGGAQRVMANLIKYFCDKGVEVCLVNDIYPDKEKKEYEIDARIRRLYLENDSKSGVLKNVRRIAYLRKIIKSESPDAVISFMASPNYRMLISTIGLNVKRIVSVRNDPNVEYGKGINKIIANVIFSLADGCVFQTEDARAYFNHRIGEKAVIIYNPVAPKFYGQKWVGDSKEILVVGRLTKQKNPLLILKAFAEIQKKYCDYILVYVGEGEYSEKIQNEAQLMGISDKVKLLGTLSNVEEKLARATVYVLSSDYEGMPNALMEAMAVGIPTIATDCPCGGPRMLMDGECQRNLIPCGDVDRLISSLDSILKDEKMRKKISVENRKRAKEFRPEIIFKQWEDYIGL